MSPITRVQPTSDETPPWKGMAFTQPVESDALHERLKKLYPGCATLRERKHMAAIDFLKAELRQMQSKDAISPTNEQFTNNPALASPEASSFTSEAVEDHSRRGSVSLSQSPASPSQLSATIEHVLQYQDTTPTQPRPIVPPATAFGQHIVFSAVDGRTLQPKIKRKMTTEEKTAYKATRKRGACRSCKRLKGKCTHLVNTSAFVEGHHQKRKGQKRSLSPGRQLISSKTPRLEQTADVHHPAPTLPRQHDPAFIDTSIVGQDISSASNQPGVESSGPRWEQGPGEGEPGQSGYVHPENPNLPYTTSLPTDTGSQWPPYPSSSGHDIFDPGYAGYMENPSQPDGVYPPSPSRHDLPTEFPFPSTFPGFDSWAQNQETHHRHTNPD